MTRTSKNKYLIGIILIFLCLSSFLGPKVAQADWYEDNCLNSPAIEYRNFCMAVHSQDPGSIASAFNDYWIFAFGVSMGNWVGGQVLNPLQIQTIPALNPISQMLSSNYSGAYLSSCATVNNPVDYANANGCYFACTASNNMQFSFHLDASQYGTQFCPDLSGPGGPGSPPPPPSPAPTPPPPPPISNPDFELHIQGSDNITISAGNQGGFMVQITSLDGMSGPVELSSYLDCPGGSANCVMDPSSYTLAPGESRTVILLINTTAATPNGTYNVGPRGSWSGHTHNDQGLVTIINGAVPTPGVCGTANNHTYPNGSSDYAPYTQCAPGNPTNTSFPAPTGVPHTWVCNGLNSGAPSGTCSATQDAPPPVPVPPAPTPTPTPPPSGPTTYEVRIDKVGQGTVKSSPPGINCGLSCSSQTHDFPPGPITLQATAASGRILSKWDGCDSPNIAPDKKTGTCTITISSSGRTVTATFILDPLYKEF